MFNFYQTYTPPFSEKIPADLERYFANKPLYKRFRSFFFRYLYAKFSLKKYQELPKITQKHQKILWIQWTDSSLGDSLMDLSSRVLLKNKTIDLLTKSKTANIYQNDTVFRKIFTSHSQCDANYYDLVIIDNYRHQSLKMIKQYFPVFNFVTMQGYYGGHDFNRTLFSFFRMNQLLSHPYDEKTINNMAKPNLSIEKVDDKIPSNAISIVIGGMSKARTYQYWQQIVSAIIANNLADTIILLGAKNAQIEAKTLTQQHKDKIINFVGRYSFNQSAYLISKSRVLLCCDGGLMHAALSVDTPVVSLFSYVKPELRLLKINNKALYDDKDVNNIRVNDIISRLNQKLKDEK